MSFNGNYDCQAGGGNTVAVVPQCCLSVAAVGIVSVPAAAAADLVLVLVEAELPEQKSGLLEAFAGMIVPESVSGPEAQIACWWPPVLMDN